MMKVVINPSWDCQLACKYCWLPHTKINRQAQEHLWHEWADAIIKHVPKGSIIDVSGGDPLLYEGLSSLVSKLGWYGINWAITTNALHTRGVNKLIMRNIPGCVVINISDHLGNLKAHENIQKIREVYRVNVHKVAHESAGHHEDNAQSIEYQAWKEGSALDGVKRLCDAGINHWVIDPSGDIFRCCVDMQVGNKPLGNLFTGIINKSEPFICEFGCSTCYTTTPSEWLVNMEVI